LLDNDIVRNGWIWGAIALCILLLLASVYLPVLSGVLKTESPGVDGWTLVIALSLLPMIIGQTIGLVQRMKPRDEKIESRTNR